MTTLFKTYCIDTNVLIDLYKEDIGRYPKDVFQTIWKHIESLISQGRLISSIEVYEELKNDSSAEFCAWLKKHKSIFREVDDEQIAFVSAILNKYPWLVQGFQNAADPFIVSLAAVTNSTVITLEQFHKVPSKSAPKIPNLCNEFGVECFNLIDYCRYEGVIS